MTSRNLAHWTKSVPPTAVLYTMAKPNDPKNSDFRAICLLQDSKISCHVDENKHKIDFEGVRVIGHEANYHETLLGSLFFHKGSTLYMALSLKQRFQETSHGIFFSACAQQAAFESRVLTLFSITQLVD